MLSFYLRKSNDCIHLHRYVACDRLRFHRQHGRPRNVFLMTLSKHFLSVTVVLAYSNIFLAEEYF